MIGDDLTQDEEDELARMAETFQPLYERWAGLLGESPEAWRGALLVSNWIGDAMFKTATLADSPGVDMDAVAAKTLAMVAGLMAGFSQHPLMQKAREEWNSTH
jgi:hypothetical protein